MKRLYSEDQRETYTEDGQALDYEVAQALKPIISKWVAKGFSLRDIRSILSATVSDQILDQLLEIRRN